MRGGSWNNQPVHARVANRNNRDPTDDRNNQGFRLARSAPSEPAIAAMFEDETDTEDDARTS